ncbi:origin recognition complex subunit 5 C-terminus-domain-containing protein [Tuber borchii]|uniref:Origin recognition complex subunit 5 C-terminus-domain-containing protein n=1 Tax=Tuber borchii TaxID=42251 RepID=A0A2T6ZGG3_TUBBO|nr:origin recognition complex subunit 5 C-terminus-domain-containing protein [Tuber borchii]
MADEMLPAELLTALNEQFPCRAPQIRRLAALVGTDETPSPPSIVLHGLEATGKTTVLRTFLDGVRASYTWIACHECVTVRQLMERISAGVTENVGGVDAGRAGDVCALGVKLSGALSGVERKHFLVLDRVDRTKEGSSVLLAALGRLGEMIPSLTVIFILSVPKPRLLSSAEPPHIHFAPYTKEESIKILSKYVRRIPFQDIEEYTEEDAKEELYVWQKFCGTVWDSLAKGTARGIVQFRAIVDEMWEPFVKPIAEGKYGTRNYSSLYLLHKEMFRQETNVIDVVVPVVTGEKAVAKMHDLPYYSKFLLCAAYLASYNPARQDAVFFMKSADFGRKKRRGGATGPTKRTAKNRKIHRRLLGPQAFPLERLQAIFAGILPHRISSSADIQTQIATLTSLRLLTKASATDVLEASTKWRVNAGWDYIRHVARSVKFDIEDFIAE